MLVSVIAPCLNEAGHIGSFVREVFRQRLPDSVRLELLVADGGSKDGTLAKLGALSIAYPQLQVLQNPERITSCALNRGIRASTGEVIVRMDIHTTYADNYIAECLAALDETGADNVGGPWVARVAGGRVSEAVALSFACRWVTGGGKAHDPAYEGPVDTVYLGCWRREAFQRFGLFDESLVRAQDSEFNFRTLLMGGRIWQTPRICSWYQPRKCVTQLFRQYGQYGYWKVATLKKHGQAASLRQLVPGAFVIVLLTLLVVSLFAPALVWAPFLLFGTYLSAGIFSAAGLCRRHARWDLLPYLPPVFAAYHFGFGCGYLRGVLDFLILNRSPAAAMVLLTRTPEA